MRLRRPFLLADLSLPDALQITALSPSLWSMVSAKPSTLLLVGLSLFLSALSPVRAGDPSAAITAVANLTDPAKLATLNTTRSANDRIHHILAALEEARLDGSLPSKTIDEAQKLTADNRAHAALVKEMLLINFTECQRFAVLTPENLERMRHGHSPLVLSGTYAGQPFEVDHIIPVADFPWLGNELANLIYLPRTLNRRKSDAIKQRALDQGRRFVAAGILTEADYTRLTQIRRWGEAATPAALDSTAPAPQPAASSASAKINLNRATIATIETLPGIGPKTAAAIIAARPLKNLKALDAIPGIGPKTIETLKDMVRF